jgi:hypothetical protein
MLKIKFKRPFCFHYFSEITIAQKCTGFQLLFFSVFHRPRSIKNSSSGKMASRHCLASVFEKGGNVKFELGGHMTVWISASVHMRLYLPRPSLPPQEVFLKIFSRRIYCLSRVGDYLLERLAIFSDTRNSKEQAVWL